MNMALTADGKIATADRRVHTFGSPRDQAHLYALRATVDALLCGAKTLEETGATLGNGGARYGRARRRRGLTEHPLRVVATRRATLHPRAPLWSARFSPVIALTCAAAPAARRRRLAGLADAVWTSPGSEVDLTAALGWLRTALGVRRLLCEGGGELNAALFRAGLVDELHLTLCPRLFGGRTAPTLADGLGAASLAEATPLEQTRSRRVGDELFLTYRVRRS
ncbi:MAG: RibD family protein [Verrucomicrobiota bacterium]